MTRLSGWCMAPEGARAQHESCRFDGCPCGCHDDGCRCPKEDQ